MPTRVANLIRILVLMTGAQTCVAETSLQGFDGFGDPEFLEVDKAFQLSTLAEKEKITVRWHIAPDYYLYKHRLQFSQQNGTGEIEKITVTLPEGKQKHDEYFGDVETYYGELEVNVPVTSENVEIHVQYQGCADAGLCYPPQNRTIER